MRDHADVIIIGGGVVGCAVAFETAKRGLKTTIIDQPRRGRATSASAGGLWPLGESLGLGCGVIFYKAQLAAGTAPDTGVGPMPLPDHFCDFALRSNDLFPALAEELLELTGMDVELDQTGLIFLMYDEGDVAYAESLRENLPCDPALLEWLGPEQVADQEPALTRDLLGAVRLHGDDQLNPYKLSDALRAGARAHGATVITHTEVTGIRTEGGRVVAVETHSATHPCDTVVNAAGSWAGHVGQMVGIDIPVRPVRGQIVCTETLPPVIGACLSTTSCYLAQKRHGEVIIGSTTEEVGFTDGVTPSAIRDLSVGAIRAVPSLARATIKRVWSGARPGTPDELPILGPVDGLEGYQNACGHFRTGILTAPLTGIIIAEAIQGSPTTVPLEPFLLSRF